MTVGRARIVKGPVPRVSSTRTQKLAVRIPSVVFDAKVEAQTILAEARTTAEAIRREAREGAAKQVHEAVTEAREAELARVAAELVNVHLEIERKLETELDHTVELARLLAERVVGEAIRVEPERIAAIAAEALKETRGARRVRIETSPADEPALRAILAHEGLEIVPNAELSRGSLIVQTEIGRVDARLEPQLARLAAAMREGLRG